MTTMTPLFEAPPTHSGPGDLTYHRWVTHRGPSALDSAFGWEEADSEHTGPRQQAINARQAFRLLRDGFARILGVGTGGQVHHKIELQVLRKYPGTFTPRELNHLRNLRGIPGEVPAELFARRQAALLRRLASQNIQPGTPAYDAAVRAFSERLRATGMQKKQFHNSYIRRYWNRRYDDLDELIQRRHLRVGMPEYRQAVRRFLFGAMRGLDTVTPGLYTEDRAKVRWDPVGAPPPRPR
jgi:hypothetical protein